MFIKTKIWCIISAVYEPVNNFRFKFIFHWNIDAAIEGETRR